jgi:hypothetical protein
VGHTLASCSATSEAYARLLQSLVAAGLVELSAPYLVGAQRMVRLGFKGVDRILLPGKYKIVTDELLIEEL